MSYNSKEFIEGTVAIKAFARNIETVKKRLLEMVQLLNDKLSGAGYGDGVLVERFREMSDAQGDDPVEGTVMRLGYDSGSGEQSDMEVCVRHVDDTHHYHR